jgi:hypothetical protein
MVVITPALAIGGAQALMGAISGFAGGQAKKQEYINQRAFQDANSQYASWQAGFNKRVTDANAQYNYWQETVNYNQNLAYSRSLQNYELLKEIRQAEVVGQTRAAAGASFVRSSEAISQQIAEASMQDAVAYQQYQVAALKARGQALAGNQEGNSIDRLVNDYARQVGDYQAIQSINEGLRTRQYNREQAGQVAQYLSQYNSQTFYEAQPYMEPIAPFAPLPSLLAAPAPTMTGSGPSGAATALNIGTGILGGVQAGMSVNAQLAQYKNSGKGGGTTDYSGAFRR